jgi:hypothetical protein
MEICNIDPSLHRVKLQRVIHKYSAHQGDQMSLQKNHPKCSPIHFWSKSIHNFCRRKKFPKIHLLVLMRQCSKNLSKDNRPMGERKFTLSCHPGAHHILQSCLQSSTTNRRDSNFIQRTVQKILGWQVGLPDGIFSNPKLPLWVIFAMESVDTYMLWPIGIVYGQLV